MTEKLPAPCEHCKGTGLSHGVECRECRGKGYRLIVNGSRSRCSKLLSPSDGAVGRLQDASGAPA